MDQTPAVHPADEDSAIKDDIQHAAQNLERLNHTVLAFIRERPGTCLCGALALGYIIGKIAARN